MAVMPVARNSAKIMYPSALSEPSKRSARAVPAPPKERKYGPVVLPEALADPVAPDQLSGVLVADGDAKDELYADEPKGSDAEATVPGVEVRGCGFFVSETAQEGDRWGYAPLRRSLLYMITAVPGEQLWTEQQEARYSKVRRTVDDADEPKKLEDGVQQEARSFRRGSLGRLQGQDACAQRQTERSA